jgi:preprotein translocase subunit Sss1
MTLEEWHKFIEENWDDDVDKLQEKYKQYKRVIRMKKFLKVAEYEEGE